MLSAPSLSWFFDACMVRFPFYVLGSKLLFVVLSVGFYPITSICNNDGSKAKIKRHYMYDK